MIAYSDPIKGQVPFEAVYEVIPQVNGSISAELLKRDVGDAVKIEQNESGLFYLTFNGMMDIDSGNDVQIEIKSEHLEISPNQCQCLDTANVTLV